MRSTILPGKGDIEPRLAVLHKLADLIDSRAEELAKIASQEMGKLIKQSRGEVKLCAQIARYYADNAKSFLAPVKYPPNWVTPGLSIIPLASYWRWSRGTSPITN